MSEIVRTTLTLREMAIISRLRKIKFGCLEVYKENGIIERIVIRENKRVTEDDGMDAVKQSVESIAIVGDSSIIKKEKVSVVYG